MGFVFYAGGHALGQDKTSPAAPTPEFTVQLKLRDELWASTVALREAGKGRESLAEAKKMLVLERRMFEADDEDLLVSMNWIAETAEYFGDLSTAEPHRAAAKAWTEKYLKADERRTSDARVAFADLKTLCSLTSEQKADVLASRRDVETFEKLLTAKKYAEARPLIERLAEMRRRLLGDKHLLTVEAIRASARLFDLEGKYREAVPLYRQVCDLRKSMLGANHPEFAAGLFDLAWAFRDLEDYPNAEKLLRQAIEIEKSSLGEHNADYAQSLMSLGTLYRRCGRYFDAEPLLLQSLAIYRELFGEKHEDVSTALNDLAFLYERMGRYKSAELMYKQSLAAAGAEDGEPTESSITTLHNLARLYSHTGDFVRSIPLSLKVVEWERRTYGDDDLDYALSLNNLGWTYFALGDYGRAEDAMLTAKRIRETRQGKRHSRYADSLDSLAAVYRNTNRREQAAVYAREAMQIYLDTFGNRHPDYIDRLSGVADDASRAKNYDRALTLLSEVRELEKEVLGPTHFDYAHTLSKLAALHRTRGEFQDAESFYREVLEIKRGNVGEANLSYAATLERLAFLYVSMGKVDQAEPLFRQALATARTCVESTAVVQSERQQLALSADRRHLLDSYLSFCAGTNRNAADVYAHVLLWKGATLVRQRAIRTAMNDPNLQRPFEELQAVSVQLSTWSRDIPKSAAERTAWRTKIDELNKRKEAVEAELSSLSGAFRQAMRDITVDDLLAVLPGDAVLVDFLEYDRIWPSEAAGMPYTWRRDFAAFVVGRSDVKENRVRLVSLGSAKAINEAVDAWRKKYGIGAEGEAAAKRLQELVWKPLVDAIGSSGTVIVSTDGALGKLPFGALPGSKPDTYLIEDIRLAMFPVPQLLPRLFSALTPKEKEFDLLLLGDVDYDGSASTEATANIASVAASVEKSLAAATASSDHRAPIDGSDKFLPLPGTKVEIEAIGKSFANKRTSPSKIRTIASFEATEARFREFAPRSRLLHIATHGFFAPERYRSASANESDVDGEGSAGNRLEQRFVGLSPNLLSGLVLAGANQTPLGDGDDGILTAEEIACLRLDDTQLVVLSACETGLGEVAGGEGLLGLQRAFQVSGARTTIASYWKVDDFVTQAIMQRFYCNLVDRDRSEPLSPLDALREAQLWALRNPEDLAKSANERSADPIRSAATEVNLQKHLRTSPRYWAAFSLSGDWR